MKQEDKQLLLKDLCARLPYGVKLMCKWKKPAPNGTTGMLTEMDSFTLDQIYNMDCEDIPFDEVKPYLFPMKNMTEEQKNECFKGKRIEIDKYGYISAAEDPYGDFQYTDLKDYLNIIDWLNTNHFDYRNLIEKSLAIDATGLNIYKEETK